MCLTAYRPSCGKERITFYAYFNSDGGQEYSFSDNCTIEDDKPVDVEDAFSNDKYPNTANQSFINDIWLVAEPSEIILKTTAFLPIVLWGIFCNGLLLYIIIKNRHLRSPTNLLIGNMATADLASLIIHPWVFLSYNFFQNYQLGAFGCKTEAAIECTILLCGVMNLCAVSYDRLTAIVLPQETRLTRYSAKIVMAVTWIGGLSLSTPFFVYRTYKERQWIDFLEKYCTENTTIFNIYWHVIITMLVWVPLTVLLVCYISIFVKLSKYEKVVLRRLKTGRVKYRKKVAKTMFIIVSTFMVCRLPFTAMIFYRNQLLKAEAISANNHSVKNQVNGTYESLWFASKYLIVANAAINPVVYGLMNEKFRRALGDISLMKWLFIYFDKKAAPVVEDKKDQQKETKETLVGSNKSKIFVIFKKNGNASSRPTDEKMDKSFTNVK